MSGNNLGGGAVRHRYEYNENTMAGGIQNSGWRSRIKLVNRYAGRSVPVAIQQICDYLASRMIATHPGESAAQNQLSEYTHNKYCVAARALKPNVGAVGLNRRDDFRTVAAYWWAANDPNNTQCSVETRQEAFVNALQECQRKILTHDITGIISEPADQIVCEIGVVNKFAELFSGLDEDVTSVDINVWAYEMLRGLLGEYLLARGALIERLPFGEHDIQIPEEVTRELRSKVLLILGEVADANVRSKLNEQLAAINYMGFLKEVPQRDANGRLVMSNHGEYMNDTVPMTPDEIQSLIANAQQALRAAQQRGEQVVTEAHYGQPTLDPQIVEQVIQIIEGTFSQSRNDFFWMYNNIPSTTSAVSHTADLGPEGNAARSAEFDRYNGI